METLQKRVDSFAKAKRVKNMKSSASKSHKWPHPADFLANPQSLAEAGFYFNPSFDDPDNVTCFICNKDLSEWEKEDDPFDVHYEKCGKSCCWASLRCGLRGDMDRTGKFNFLDKSRIPNTRTMEKARLETFQAGKGWIHDRTKSHGANSRRMAQAGFIFTPQYSDDDLATCLYCNVALSGWDAEDNPTDEHRKREKKFGYTCPFFVYTPDNASTSGPSQDPSKLSTIKPSKEQSRPTLRCQAKKSKHQDTVMPTKTHDGDPGAESDDLATAERSTKTQRRARSSSRSRKSTLSKSAKTPGKITRSVSRTSTKADLEEEEDVLSSPPPKISKQRIRTSSKSFKRQEQTPKEPVIPRKTSHSRSKATDDSDDNEVPRKSSRTKLRPTTVQEEIEVPIRKPSRSKSRLQNEEENSCHVSEAEELQTVRKTTKAKLKLKAKKPTRASSKTKVVETLDTEDNDSGSTFIPFSHENQPFNTNVSPPPILDEMIVVDSGSLNNLVALSPSTLHQTIEHPGSPFAVEMTPLFIPGGDLEANAQAKGKMTSTTPRISGPEISRKQATAPEKLFAVIAKPNHNAKEKSKKVVEISTDEEDEDDAQPITETLQNQNLPPGPAFKSDGLSRTTTLSHPQKEDTEMLDESANSEVQVNGVPRTPKRTPSTPVDPSIPGGGVEIAPSSSLIPPLSKLPFVPLTTLTDAELDMTVEEWIRYQMEIEYDKFKRDGERELLRFRKRAEDVRKAIEGLGL